MNFYTQLQTAEYFLLENMRSWFDLQIYWRDTLHRIFRSCERKLVSPVFPVFPVSYLKFPLGVFGDFLKTHLFNTFHWRMSQRIWPGSPNIKFIYTYAYTELRVQYFIVCEKVRNRIYVLFFWLKLLLFIIYKFSLTFIHY